jgi:hypothetical protein
MADLSRRQALFGIIAAPAIVRASSLMKLPPRKLLRPVDVEFNVMWTQKTAAEIYADINFMMGELWKQNSWAVIPGHKQIFAANHQMLINVQSH